MGKARGARRVARVAEVRAAVAEWRASGETVAFVPTMGNLHAGHISLTELAAAAADRVVLSIFVNPTQFGPNEDFAAYPRTLGDDEAKIAAAGTVDLVFVPAESEIYPFGLQDSVRIVLPSLAHELCGAVRPGHFDGVASVVCRLLNIVTPDVLFLGAKDYQQAMLVGRMIEDLRLTSRLQLAPTIREADGLAMSSRNRYLEPAERRRAPVLYATLGEVCSALRGGARDFAALEASAKAKLAAAGFRPDYVEIRRASDLGKPQGTEQANELMVLAAAHLGRARLIDNLRV